jgi:hypothetical protein
MKGCLANVGRVVVAMLVWLVVSFVPLVPAMQAPVVPNPIYEMRLVSIQQLVGVGLLLMGVSNKATWATLPVMIGLTVAALAGGWWLGGVIFRRRRQPPA